MGRLEVRGSKRLLVLGATVLVAIATFVGTALAQSPNAADKVPIWQTARLSCSGNNAPAVPTIGFANIRSDGNGPVVAEVTLKDGVPNSTYNFFLIQTPEGACNRPVDGSITTNGQGNGNVRLSVAKRPDATGAFVFAFSPQLVVSGHYVFGSK